MKANSSQSLAELPRVGASRFGGVTDPDLDISFERIAWDGSWRAAVAFEAPTAGYKTDHAVRRLDRGVTVISIAIVPPPPDTPVLQVFETVQARFFVGYGKALAVRVEVTGTEPESFEAKPRLQVFERVLSEPFPTGRALEEPILVRN